MRFVIDRIEGSVAVLETEDGGFRDVEVAQLPAGVAEGDVLEWVEGEGSEGLREGFSGTGTGTDPAADEGSRSRTRTRTRTGTGSWRVVTDETGSDPYEGLKTDDGDVKL